MSRTNTFLAWPPRDKSRPFSHAGTKRAPLNSQQHQHVTTVQQGVDRAVRKRHTTKKEGTLSNPDPRSEHSDAPRTEPGGSGCRSGTGGRVRRAQRFAATRRRHHQDAPRKGPHARWNGTSCSRIWFWSLCTNTPSTSGYSS